MVSIHPDGVNVKNDSCPCKNVDCKNHGNCHACKLSHESKEYKPYCMRENNT